MRLAEKQGFEPWLGIHPLSVFETDPFDRLGTSPEPYNPNAFRPFLATKFYLLSLGS